MPGNGSGSGVLPMARGQSQTPCTAAAVSGGQDSLLALALLREAGEEALAVHAFFLPPDRQARDNAVALAETCRGLGARFLALDLHEQFETLVVQPFIDAYQAGRTPNPCALCNPRLKFGLLLDQAAQRTGATAVATGHYARLQEHPHWGRVLVRGADPAKDQSYFLCLVPGERLAKARFPLGEWRKQDVAEALSQRGLEPPLPRESQEICFVPHDDYCAFLELRAHDLPGPGPVLLDGREIGVHQGLWRYTQGQRRGLGIAWSEPLYVTGKDPARNALLVGTAAALASPGCVAREVNLLVPPREWPSTVWVRTRYRQDAAPAAARLEAGSLRVDFHAPGDPPAPGQVLCLYDQAGPEAVVLAGGIIERGLEAGQ
jgi:tRNA-specific 2-thiouridylase